MAPRLVCFVAMALCANTLHAAEPAVDFNRDIRPLLSRNCYACHGPDDAERQGDLRLDLADAAYGKGSTGELAIVPGKRAESEVFRRISSDDAGEQMPPPKSGHELTKAQIELIGRWIDEGAKFSPHWAFVAPKRIDPPRVASAWPRNPIDHFLLARLAAEKLEPAPEADRYALIRRLSLDLRGLPPTIEEVDAFVADQRPDAYERLVDTFLADPAYGERWARMWLDLARYADSMGYGSDPLRLNIWRYRDWVIDAFNRNLPFDQFTREQLAGDLLKDASLDQIIATAFHRNTMTNTEGGTDDEEFRVAAVKDRVDTTLQVWMGVTVGCAKCHNHKYEPITQEEYYKLFAIFNQTADADRGDEGPLVSAPSADMLDEIKRIDADLAALKTKLSTSTPELLAAQAKWEAEFAIKSDWTVLVPQELKAESKATLAKQADNSVLVSGAAAPTDAYTITAVTNIVGVNAVRLEAIPDASLPNGGSGRAADGNFVLSKFSVVAEDADRVGQPVAGRYVRIELPGAGKMISLAEVEVLSGGKNVAKGAQATQSSTDYEGPPNLAVDGNTNGDYFAAKSTTHTKAEDNPWWEVDLGSALPIDQIKIWGRTDGGTYSRLAGFKLLLLDADRKPLYTQEKLEAPNPSQEYSPSGKQTASLATASVDYAQDNFPPSNINAADPTASGWAVGQKTKEPHAAVFPFTVPLNTGKTTRLTIRLEHRFKQAGYTLGRFRLSVLADPQIAKRAPLPADVQAALGLPADRRSPAQRDALTTYFRSIAPELAPVRDQIAQLEKARPVPPMLPIMQELPEGQRRKTHLMIKGNFLTTGAEVAAGLPAVFDTLPPSLPRNRATLADWLIAPENPLTARVTVNRFWAQLFGAGLVETEEDFGSQGDLPTHPELLDWLAVEFQAPSDPAARPWDVQRLLKLIVTSAAYRQSAQATPAARERDPRNRLLSRGPRFRLEAEMVRDQALALSGLLTKKLGGPSVYPPQPPGLWQAAFNGQRNWATSTGPDRYRRGLYTFWRRTVPYPSMATFDAPSREICSIRRIRTNTPLQAFVTLNDPVYVEAAQALARRIQQHGGPTPATRAAWSLRLCLARPPLKEEIEAVTHLYTTELAHFQTHPEEATPLATDPLGPLPAGLNPAETAAWTVVGNVLLNLDGVLMK